MPKSEAQSEVAPNAQAAVFGSGTEQLTIDLRQYPAGTKAIGIDALAAEAHRLSALLLTIDRIESWLAAMDNVDDSVAEGLAVAAIVTFCTCFEGTTGHRQKPLKPKELFTSLQRQSLTRLRTIRNKLLAHDDGLFPMNATWALMNSAAFFLEASTLSGHVNWKGSVALAEMIPLVTIAREWTANAVASEHDRIVDSLRDLPLADRQKVFADAPEYVINIITKNLPG